MSSTFTSNLLLIEMTPGDPAVFNAWGTNLNSGMIALVDSAIAGILTVADVTSLTGYPDAVPTSTSGAADQARNAHFKLSGVLSATTLILFPAGLQRNFTLFNNTTGAHTLDVGVNNGSGGAAGTTVRVPQTQSVFLLSDGTNVTSRFNSFVGGLTVDTLTVGALSAPLPVAQGGTGLATLTAHAVIAGNGTSAPAFIAPSTSGNVLTSNGTDWTSATPATVTSAFRTTSSVSGTNTIAATASPVPGSYAAGDTYEVTLANTITGAATVNFNGLGAQNLKVNLGTGLAACAGGEGVQNGTYLMVYDGTQFILQNPTPQEGSWTPVLAGSGTAGAFTYTTQVGRFIRQGNLVWVNAHVLISAISVSPVGNVLITGLPFTASNVANLQGALAVGRWAGLTLTASYTQVSAEVNLNTTQVQLIQSGSAQVVASVAGSGVGTTAEIIISGSYRIG